MKRFKGLKGTIIFLILAAMIVGYYFYLSSRTYETPDYKDNVMSKVDITLSRNLYNDYPPTPKEVVKYLAEINRCYYNEEYTDEQLKKLVHQERDLYDYELAAYNSEETQLTNIAKEIKSFKDEGYYINTVEFTQSIDVDEFKKDGYTWATLFAKYTLKRGHLSYVSDYKYLLRKDDAGHWKVYGWTVVAEDE